MSDQINDGLKQLRQELVALDSSIADLRLEADRLRVSAQARSALALLERSAAPPEAPVWEDSAPAFALDYLPQHIADGLSADAPESEAATETPAEAPAETPDETPAPVAVDTDAERADAPSPDKTGATVLEFPGSGDAVTQEVAGFFAESLRRTDESDERSPLANADQDVEAAFDKFFSADVEPEPAQRWLLSD